MLPRRCAACGLQAAPRHKCPISHSAARMLSLAREGSECVRPSLQALQLLGLLVSFPATSSPYLSDHVSLALRLLLRQLQSLGGPTHVRTDSFHLSSPVSLQ
jgi:hypothetical protein